jgi:hypothetical protein
MKKIRNISFFLYCTDPVSSVPKNFLDNLDCHARWDKRDFMVFATVSQYSIFIQHFVVVTFISRKPVIVFICLLGYIYSLLSLSSWWLKTSKGWVTKTQKNCHLYYVSILYLLDQDTEVLEQEFKYMNKNNKRWN